MASYMNSSDLIYSQYQNLDFCSFCCVLTLYSLRQNDSPRPTKMTLGIQFLLTIRNNCCLACWGLDF